MDPLTHTLTGLALSRAGLRRWTAHATPVLLLAANAPDLDIVTLAGGSVNYLHYHRHITHSLIAIPFMAILPLLIVRLFARKAFDWKRAYAVSLVGAASHPLLDFMNTYGIRWFLPFSGRWVHADLFNIVDLWVWMVLIVAAVAPLLSRLVSAEIGARPGSGRGWAVLALLFLVFYSGGRYFLHQRAVETLGSRLYDGAAAVGVAALPGPANPFRWTGLVETAGAYSFHDLNLLGEFDPSAAQTLYKSTPSSEDQAAAEAARRTEAFQVFLGFSQYPFWRFQPASSPEGATRVEAMDLRFGAPPPTRFLAWAVVSRQGQVAESGFSFR